MKHNSQLTSRAQQLRRDMTKEERKLWYGYLSKYPHRFRRQVTCGHFILDFYCAAAKLAIELDGFTLLNAGDLSGLYERYAAVPADVLKAAHHGSSDSTSAAFLDFVSPACVLLSTGSGNRALPGATTLERLQERDISVLRTNECGDITLSVQNGVLTITPYIERTVP